MAKIFTITEGVENMGAIKTGGQGSVYKGRRIGEIITAIKILPTPIHSESGDDKNFVSFQNEVQKLKKVNEDANPNVVTILNSGITDSGNFPFIEMEFIEGPDLAELVKPPHDLVFTIQETLKVAEQLSNALAHCHEADVKHGDLKSNNVKFNIHSGNYVLLDFGLSVMSDEQRRTSLRQAGAIEFMAPEQNEGLLLFETEVYSFGVILFELLSGTVPFPLKDNGESARNLVMVSHMETAPPNLLSLRQRNMPAWWSKEKKELEMQVPQWLIGMVYKCLEKKPTDRFANGMELHEYIVQNSILAAGNVEWGAARIARLEQENEVLKKDREAIAQKLADYEKMKGSNGLMLETLQTAAPGKTKLFAGKNLLIFFLLLVVAALIVAFIFAQKNAIPQQANATDSALRSSTPGAEEKFQLAKAKDFLINGRVEEARLIYKALAIQEIPEAMFEYANLTLLNSNDKSNCREAVEYLGRAAAKGSIAAERTLGFLYAFAGDSAALKQRGYQLCSINYDIPRGSKLLMEATLRGDTTAGSLLDELNLKYGQSN
ncbi:MAG: protein kinase [Ferruginibacter sp.]|nr:protein kinase [Ferruginibacter sp.]